ncbi:MAG: M48 family metallopeptidase [Thiolinea sp.]
MKTITEQRLYFESLVTRAEQEINQQPQAYKRHLQRLVYLGYAVIFGVFISLVLLAGGTTWLALTSSAVLLVLLKTKLIVVLAVLLWVLARSVFVRIPKPQGYSLERKDHSELWSEVDKISNTLSTPPIHQIILDTQMNAAIAQTPRFGLIGPTHNTLIIGLELLLALSTQQARSVLAHELAHLSGNHSKFAGKIYRLRHRWETIHQAFAQADAFGTGLISKFFAWYAPYFAGYSYVLARANEYAADYIASQLTSREAAASALVSVHVLGEFTQQHFWKPLFERPYTQAQPESQIYSLLRKFYQQADLKNDDFKRYLRSALNRKTDASDTHPALMERLKALKLSHLQTGDAQEQKAIAWLEPGIDQVFKHFNYQWVETYGAHWDDLHERSKLARETVNQLRMRVYEDLTQKERWQLAQLTAEYLPEKDALPLYQRYAKFHPEDTEADLVIGQLLLERDDASGINYVEEAMLQPNLQLAAAEAAWRFYSKHNDLTQAKRWLLHLEAATDQVIAARQERADLHHSDVLTDPSMDAITTMKPLLLDTLAKHKKVKAIWLAQKQVEHFQNNPVYVIAVKVRGFVLNQEKLQTKLLNELQLPTDAFLINSASHKKLFKQASTVGQRIY